MHLIVNGQPREVPDGTRLPGLVADTRGVAIAVNGAVVRSGEWPSTVLRERDRIEIITARQGG